MKKFLTILGTLVTSVVFSYLFWLLFHWLTPYVMTTFTSLWEFLGFVFLAGALYFSVIMMIVTFPLLSIFIILRTGNSMVAKIINIIPMTLHCISAIIDVWTLNMDYGLLQCLLGLFMTVAIGYLFVMVMVAPFQAKLEENNK